MTIFPTRKTELKTKLSKQEAIERLEFNKFYHPNTDYELRKFSDHFMLVSVNRINHPPKANTFRAKTIINQKEQGSTVTLRYYPDEGRVGIDLTVLIILIVIQIILIITAVLNSYLSLAVFIPIIIATIYYLIQLILFSVLAISLEKQIEEAIEAEIHEVTEDEMSKLQKWYEKKR